MLVIRRTEGQWVHIRHEASGDMLRLRLYDLETGRAHLAFDDDERNFAIERPDRKPHPSERGRGGGPNPYSSRDIST